MRTVVDERRRAHIGAVAPGKGNERELELAEKKQLAIIHEELKTVLYITNGVPFKKIKKSWANCATPLLVTL